MVAKVGEKVAKCVEKIIFDNLVLCKAAAAGRTLDVEYEAR